MNWPSARSSRASPLFSTTKREPDILAAVSKSIMPRSSPISKCCFAPRGSSGCRSGGAPRCRARRRRRGTSSFGRFGIAASASCSAFSGLALLLLELRQAFLQGGDLRHQFLGARLVLRPWPARSPWRAHCGVSVAACEGRDRGLAASSRAIRCADSGSRPRFARPWSNLRGLSRMERMSCMGKDRAHKGAVLSPET